MVWDLKLIPRDLLESHAELKNLLVAREMLKPIPRHGTRSEGVTSRSSPSWTVSQSNRTPPKPSTSTILLISDDDETDVEITPVQRGPPSFQRILVERARLDSSPDTSSLQVISAHATSSSPASSDQDEIEQLLRKKVDTRCLIILYVFTQVGMFS